ncbi:hypothetical protein B0H17DRAFT_1200098 [Mycena rosella]|uniref:Uncharacterized protein n=1 Tax=Mycena rosella TaxID=1033263 RepID=A0AAD7DK04_MYCRO|nr:hypothetical protein B0H17DRAFT_1200098 [Mycena rosella]
MPMDVELDHGFFQEEPATMTNLCLHNTLPTCLTERLFNNLTALVLINLWDTPFLSEFIRIFRATTHLEFLHLENADCVPDAEYDDTDIALPFLRAFIHRPHDWRDVLPHISHSSTSPRVFDILPTL